MADYKKMSSEMLCFTLSHIESQIASYIHQKKDIMDELKRRNEIYKRKFEKGEIVPETNEFVEEVLTDE